MSKRVLITGVTGALGRELIARLRAKPNDFVCFAPRRGRADDSLDLLDQDQIARTIERTRPDLILHLAATFSNNFDEAYALNVTAARCLLDVVEASDRPTRVVLVGSAAEYGIVTEDGNPIREDHVLRPVSVYGITKAWQTELAYLYACRGVDVVVTRIFNLMGPHLSERLFIGRLLKQIDEFRRGERMQIEVGPLSAIRDYLSIEEAVSQILVIADFGEAGEVYHVASGQPIIMRDLLVRELAAHGLDTSIVVEGAALTNRRGYDVPAIYADVKKTTALLMKGEAMSGIKLTVVAPVFNEEEVIALFHARLCEVLETLNDVEAKVLYVVDRCTDNTLDVLRALVKSDSRTKVIALSSRFGHQMSLVAGIDNALDSDAVIMMDSDLQHPPELIPEMIDNFRRGFEVVYSVRRDTEAINPLRKLAGNIFYRLLGKISHIPMNANAADFRLISGRVAKVLSTDFGERNMFLRGLFTWVGFRQTSVEYVARKRGGGHSKYSLSEMMQLAVAGILSFSTKPLQLGIFAGAIFSLVAFVMVIWAIAEYFFDELIPSGWTTLTVLLLMFSGIQLIVLGVIGAYIGGIYEEVKGRPRYIIDEEISYHD